MNAAALASATSAGQTQKSGAPPEKNALGELSNNYEMFLQLLTTQLKNQDPLQPQESSEFTNQLVQFSQVEQQISSNKKLDELKTAINNGQPTQALGYMGGIVEYQGDVVPLQNGKAEMGITLESTPEEAVLVLRDASTGKVVRTMPLQETSRTQRILWDGKDNNGKQREDGNFKIEIEAVDKAGKQVAGAVRVAGTVTGVDMATGSPLLMLGDLPIQMAHVLAVR